MDGILTVTIKHKFNFFTPNSPRNRCIHTIFLQASIAAMYSTSMVEKDTTFCSLDTQDTDAPTKVNK